MCLLMQVLPVAYIAVSVQYIVVCAVSSEIECLVLVTAISLFEVWWEEKERAYDALGNLLTAYIAYVLFFRPPVLFPRYFIKVTIIVVCGTYNFPQKLAITQKIQNG